MPEKITLTTKQAVDAIPYATKGQGQAVYYCTDLTGFGVRAGAREKTFILWRRVNGKPRLIKLGGMRVTFLKRRSWMNTTDF